MPTIGFWCADDEEREPGHGSETILFSDDQSQKFFYRLCVAGSQVSAGQITRAVFLYWRSDFDPPDRPKRISVKVRACVDIYAYQIDAEFPREGKVFGYYQYLGAVR